MMFDGSRVLRGRKRANRHVFFFLRRLYNILGLRLIAARVAVRGFDPTPFVSIYFFISLLCPNLGRVLRCFV